MKLRHFDPSAQGPMVVARVAANLVPVLRKIPVNIAGLLSAFADEDSLQGKK